jgi:hypothetical protein
MKNNLSPSERERLAKLFKDHGLAPDDVFVSNHFTIVTRTGIEKIQALKGIEVEFVVESLAPDFVVIRALGTMDEKNDEGKTIKVHRVETFGSATSKNNRNPYAVEMAEKRALSRVVLKLCGLYREKDVIGEDERPQE